jgi:hypothetical protein
MMISRPSLPRQEGRFYIWLEYKLPMVTQVFTPRFALVESSAVVRAALRKSLIFAGALLLLLVCLSFALRAAPTPHAQPLALQLAVTQDLRIINGFAATMPAWAIQQLAQSAAVRWLSMDSGLSETACADCINTNKLLNAYISAIGAVALLLQDEPLLNPDQVKYRLKWNSVQWNSDYRGNQLD